jgi:hypothetical protein
MFALTPHGTQFAAPVTITIPFDASATNGATPLLYKTNAQGTWETVAGATFNSGLATAQISSFSYAQVVIPPLTRNEPTRSWIFRLWPGDGGDPIELENLVQEGGDLDQIIDFGESSSLTGEFSRLNETVLEDFIANGYVFGTNNGVTYGAVAEAPDGRLGTPEAIGSETLFGQAQSFVKNADDARLKYTITAVTIITEDFNPPLLTRPAPLVGQVTFELVGLEPQEFYRIAGTASLFGANDHFFYEAETSADSPEFLWFNEHFTIRNEDVAVRVSPGSYVELRRHARDAQARAANHHPGGHLADQDRRRVHRVVERQRLHLESSRRRRRRRLPGLVRRRVPARPRQHRGHDDRVRGASRRRIIRCRWKRCSRDPTTQSSARRPPIRCPKPARCSSKRRTSSVDESPNATPVIAITRTGGATGKVSANFATISGGTATSDEDYTEVNTTVYFADGESGRRLMRVPVRRDIRPEGDETVRIALSEPGGCAALGNQQKALLTIRDDSEIVPVLVFSVGGSVAGVKGSGLVIEEATTGTRVTPTADGDFTFVYRFPQGTPYNVRIASNPTKSASNLPGQQSHGHGDGEHHGCERHLHGPAVVGFARYEFRIARSRDDRVSSAAPQRLRYRAMARSSRSATCVSRVTTSMARWIRRSVLRARLPSHSLAASTTRRQTSRSSRTAGWSSSARVGRAVATRVTTSPSRASTGTERWMRRLALAARRTWTFSPITTWRMKC